MTSAQQRAALAGANCEVAFDNLTRQLYATDASLYQLEPMAVAFPHNARQAGALIQAAVQAGVSVTPRGAGTGLVGGALGDGLIIDFARHNRQITDLDLERQTVRVGAGVVLDQLNAFLRPHGYCFGPDVATGSRATLGGMIANNSSGAHTPVYGTTADHVRELEIVTSSGQVVMVGAAHDTLRAERELVRNLLYFHAATIEERLPGDLRKRRPGYALERSAREPDNLNHLLCGSEGTLAAIISAELRILPLPQGKSLALVFFDSVAEAMQATVELLDLKPAAIEHLDRVLLDQTRGQREFQAARDLLRLDDKPCESLLMIEFFDPTGDGLAAVARRRLGCRKLILKTAAEADLVWKLRKAGLSLLTGRKGAAKPVTGIEDTAVRPEQLPEYVAALESRISGRGLEASYYGHAAAGLLHVRPVLDLHSAEDVRKFRELADEVSAIVREFRGSLAAEHGVGIARTEYMARQVGESLLGAMREIKDAFDPHNLFNPGKIIPDGRFNIDANLRATPGGMRLPFQPVLAFAAKDGSFIGNLEQCNGCGGCRKESPTMCPTFLVTHEELMSTRGRANLIRAALEGRGLEGADPLRSAELEAALSNCLSCKACTSECPSNVNLSLLKAELLHARIQRDGLSWRQRLFSRVDSTRRPGLRAAHLGQCRSQFSAAARPAGPDAGHCLAMPAAPVRQATFRPLVRRPRARGSRAARACGALGRYLRAVPRTTGRGGRYALARSRRVHSQFARRAQLLRPPRVQPGTFAPGPGVGVSQPGAAEPGYGGSAHTLSRAVVLLDVCRGLSGARVVGVGENCPALFPVRTVCRESIGGRTGGAAV